MSVRTYVLLGFLGAIVLGAFLPLQPETAVASTHGATRSYSAPWVLPEGELQVTVSASGYGGFGLLQETLPEGFTFVATSLDAATVKVEGQTVTFTLLGVELVTYNVAAPTTERQYDFSGFLLDMQKQEAIVAGPHLSGLARSRRPHPHQRKPPRQSPRSRPTRRRPPRCSPRRRRRWCRGRRPCPRPRQRRDPPRPRQPLLRRLPSLRTKRRKAVRLSICGCRWHCLWSPF